MRAPMPVSEQPSASIEERTSVAFDLLELVLSRIGRPQGTRGPSVEALTRALDALSNARDLVATDGRLTLCLETALDEITRARDAAAPPVSFEVEVLDDLAGALASLRTSVRQARSAKGLEDDDSMVDDDDEGWSSVLEAPSAEEAALMLLDIGVLATDRRPQVDEAWQARAATEERLLEQSAAFVEAKLGAPTAARAMAVFEDLAATSARLGASERVRAGALGMVVAQLTSAPAARWLLCGLAEGGEQRTSALIDALSLSGNAFVGRIIGERLPRVDDPNVLEAMLEIARRRGDVDATAIALLLAHPHQGVASRAAAALARAPSDLAVPLLSTCLSEGPALALAAAETLACFGSPQGVRAMRQWLESDLAFPAAVGPRPQRALRVLASNGAIEDEPLVLAAALAVPGGLPWLGTFGHAPHADILVRKAADARVAKDARLGLSRMAGGSLEDADGPALEAARKRVHAVNARVRRGFPHAGVTTTLQCLADPATRVDERAGLSLELGLSTGVPCSFDVDGWIEVQRRALEEYRAKYHPQ